MSEDTNSTKAHRDSPRPSHQPKYLTPRRKTENHPDIAKEPESKSKVEQWELCTLSTYARQIIVLRSCVVAVFDQGKGGISGGGAGVGSCARTEARDEKGLLKN